MRPAPPPHVVRLVPAIYQGELIDWAGTHEQTLALLRDWTFDEARERLGANTRRAFAGLTAKS